MGDPNVTTTADFETALRYVLPYEGFYSNNANDPGGETIYGIARTKHPEWTGWKQVDEARTKPDFPACLRNDPGIISLMFGFYRTVFWDGAGYDKLVSQRLANLVFDMAINQGPQAAGETLQLSLLLFRFTVLADGKIGPATIMAANRCIPDQLVDEFKAQRALRYAKWYVGDPVKREAFVTGLLRRAVKG